MSSSRTSSELARLKSNSYWREEEGRLAVEAWRASGESLSTFARQQGLSAGRLRWWRDRLQERKTPAPIGPAAIVPVTLIASAPPVAPQEATMEIVLASGHVVRVGADFDADALGRLVRTLEGSW